MGEVDQPPILGVAGEVIGRFFVPGRARTKGSLKPQPARGKGGRLVIHMVESGEYSVPWKRTMIKEIRRVYGFKPPVKAITVPGRVGKKLIFAHEPYTGPVRVDFVALFAPEIGVSGEAWESHNTPFPTAMSIGDGDKLERNLWDALTQSGLIEDDRWVTKWSGEKRWVSTGERAGIDCMVTAL